MVTNTPFQPPGGLTSDDTIFAAPGRWLNGSWVRFYNGSWQSKGGWERLTLQALKGVCRSIISWTDGTDDWTLGFGLHNGLQVWRDSLVVDITPTSFLPGAINGTGGAGFGTGAYGVGTFGSPSTTDYFPLTWSLATWGYLLLANPRGQTIFQWDGITADLAAPLAGAPAQVTYTVVTPQRQVMALGCNEEVSGAFNALCIRWSDIEDNTDWIDTPANNAGEYILEGAGRIVCGRVMGDYVLIWTTVDLFLGTFVGDPGQTWKFDRIGGNCGAVSPGAPLVRNLNAMWLASDATFWSYSLGSAAQQVNCPIRSMFADHLTAGQGDKINAYGVNTFQEIGWSYPDARDGFECSRAVNIGPEGWSRDVIERTAAIDAGPQLYPIATDAAGRVFLHEKGNSADGGVLSGFIESAGFYLSQAEGGVKVNGVWPDFKGQIGSLQMTVFLREFPQSAERTHGPWVLPPSQPKRSFRAEGRIARLRFDFASSPAFVRGGKPEFDIAPIGGR